METEKLYGALTEEQKRLYDYLEENDYRVYLFEQEDRICAEVENWTDGDVDMIVTLMPFGIGELQDYCNGFDIDDQIEMHRQDQRYRDVFTISESLRDFTDWLDSLKSMIAGFYGEPNEPEPQTSDPEDIIQKLQEWADDFPCWLSERAEYARGYKAGIILAKQTVNSIIHSSADTITQ